VKCGDAVDRARHAGGAACAAPMDAVTAAGRHSAAVGGSLRNQDVRFLRLGAGAGTTLSVILADFYKAWRRRRRREAATESVEGQEATGALPVGGDTPI
jgi:hypothetical protein